MGSVVRDVSGPLRFEMCGSVLKPPSGEGCFSALFCYVEWPPKALLPAVRAIGREQSVWVVTARMREGFMRSDPFAFIASCQVLYLLSVKRRKSRI